MAIWGTFKCQHTIFTRSQEAVRTEDFTAFELQWEIRSLFQIIARCLMRISPGSLRKKSLLPSSCIWCSLLQLQPCVTVCGTQSIHENPAKTKHWPNIQKQNCTGPGFRAKLEGHRGTGGGRLLFYFPGDSSAPLQTKAEQSVTISSHVTSLLCG